MPTSAACLHCARRKGQRYLRLLCRRCYDVPSIRDLYPKVGHRVTKPCKHCGRHAAHRRGICTRCIADPEIDALYPARTSPNAYKEPTEEELDAMIAEQMANLPDWWTAEYEKMTAGMDV